MEEFHRINDNSRWFRSATARLSTIEMPDAVKSAFNYSFESCLFHANGNSDVIARYDTAFEALEGHVEFSRKYGLNTVVK